MPPGGPVVTSGPLMWMHKRRSISGNFPRGVPTGGTPAFIVTTNSHTTISQSGNTTLACKAQLPASIPAPEGGAIVLQYIPCNTQGGFATGSHAVITPSGKIIHVCPFKAS